MLLASDARVGADGPFKIGLNEVQIGMPLPILGMELARQRLAPAYLTAATLFATTVEPSLAATWGYLDTVVPTVEVRARAVAEATRLGALAQPAYAKTKIALREATIRYVRATLADDMQRLTVGVPGT